MWSIYSFTLHLCNHNHKHLIPVTHSHITSGSRWWEFLRVHLLHICASCFRTLGNAEQSLFFSCKRNHVHKVNVSNYVLKEGIIHSVPECMWCDVDKQAACVCVCVIFCVVVWDIDLNALIVQRDQHREALQRHLLSGNSSCSKFSVQVFALKRAAYLPGGVWAPPGGSAHSIPFCSI